MKFLAATLLMLSSMNAFAIDLAQNFNFDGYLTDAGGNPITGSANVTFQIYNPSENCLIFEENHSALVLDSNGGFSVKIGSGIRASGSVDGGKALKQIFSNDTQVRSTGTNCSSGYTPTAADGRKLKITVNGTPLSPSYALSPVPMATVAETLQGIPAEGFLKLSSGALQVITSNVKIDGDLRFGSGGGNYVGIAAYPGTPTYNFTLPSTPPSNGQIMVADGAGGMNWQPIGGGGSVTNVTGTANQISVDNSVPSTPVIGLADLAVSPAGTYGSPTQVPIVTVDNKGRITSVTNTTISVGGGSPVGSSLNSGQIWAGNASNMAAAVYVSGDATMSNFGALNVTGIQGNSVAGGTPTDGQVLRWAAGEYEPRHLTVSDIRSAANMGISVFPSSCTSAQTMTWSALSDTFTCANIMIPNTQITGLSAGNILNTPAGTIAATTVQAALNELDGDLSSKISKAGDTMTGSLIVPPGSVSSPTLAFSDSPTTGIYSYSPGTFGIAASGVQVLGLSNSGISTYKQLNSQVGISQPYVASNGSSDFPVSTSGSSFLASNGAFVDNNTALLGFSGYNASSISQKAYIGIASTPGGASYTPAIVIGQKTGATSYEERMRIDSNGNVGIGITAPTTDYGTKIFHHHNGSGDASLIHMTNSTTGSAVNKGAYIGYFGSALALPNPVAGIMARGTGDDVVLGTQNTARLLVHSTTGNVVIGSTVPGTGTKLHVSGQIASTSSNMGASSSIDFSGGNSVTTSFNCSGNISLANLRDGGSYTVVVTDTGTTQCSFSSTTSGDEAGAVTYRFNPANGARTAATHTMYRMNRIGTVVYVEWKSFQ